MPRADGQFWEQLLQRTHALRSLAWDEHGRDELPRELLDAILNLSGAEVACLASFGDGAAELWTQAHGQAEALRSTLHASAQWLRELQVDTDAEIVDASNLLSEGLRRFLVAPMENLAELEGCLLETVLIRVDGENPRILLAAGKRMERLQPSLRWLAEAALRAAAEADQVHALRHDANTDELTGAANYRQLLRRMDEWLGEDRPFLLLMIDVDNLKQYNAQFGHLAGSGALAQIAQLLQEQLRPGDLLAKYGGDEFCVLLPGRSQREARAVADALRTAVRRHAFDGESGRRLSVSVGLAGASEEASSAKQLLLEVDALLFRAKAEGRDRTVAAGELARA